MFTRHVLLLALVAVSGFSQTATTLNLSTQSRNVDFSNFPFTRPLTQGSNLPSTCQVGQLFFNTAAPVGTNVVSCVSPNTWATVGGGGSSYVLPQASSTTLGGVTVPGVSGLAVSSGGALSVIYGATSNTAVQGNDTRITGALQSANSLSDVASVTTALQNLKLTGAAPNTISASTTGNAASATSLQGTGALQILGGTGSAPSVTAGQLGMWFDATDLNVHLLDPNNNKSTLIRTSANGTSTNCAATGFVTGFQSNGVPSCGSLSAINGKIGIVSGGSTTVSSCGTSPVLTGNDSAGIVVPGAGTVTSCTVTFSSAFVNVPICTAGDNTDFVLIRPSATNTTLTLTAQSSINGDSVSYICIGK
jgi:hypothetical protein